MESEGAERNQSEHSRRGGPEDLHGMPEPEAAKDVAVPAANFVRGFARWCDKALTKPVFVTKHGRITHALINIDRYAEMNEELPVETHDREANPFELAEWIDEAVIICDNDLIIESMNRIASATCGISASQCVGRRLYDCLPKLRGTLFDVHLMRTVEANESTSADIPSPLREEGWLRLQSFPLHGRNVLMFRDITEEVKRHRLADVKAALIEAMSVHNAIGYVRVDVSGLIERVDEPFCDLLGLPTKRLLGARLIDLITRENRVAFKAQLQEAMAGNGARRLTSRFISNSGETEDLVAAIVQLRGAYGAEGAVILLTPVHIDLIHGADQETARK
ncbi:PAS domain-containing protein [Pseudoblastomonas halimionae]|uniref:PAS domain-containing protein n=1 Tax=Alteriqipengyuania halimionae TaxID=1926630 RepID=A0A6I4U815_9SPHN|nr:PAS domain-containing protein [Alteriqipengyuania halimionae]MXP10387.1 PAS domain-containing protein [Alteriqipengyuania halimionae]